MPPAAHHPGRHGIGDLFTRVALDAGFEAWRQEHPRRTHRGVGDCPGTSSEARENNRMLRPPHSFEVAVVWLAF